jgi:hypothetical protein
MGLFCLGLFIWFVGSIPLTMLYSDVHTLEHYRYKSAQDICREQKLKAFAFRFFLLGSVVIAAAIASKYFG